MAKLNCDSITFNPKYSITFDPIIMKLNCHLITFNPKYSITFDPIMMKLNCDLIIFKNIFNCIQPNDNKVRL